MPLYGGFLPLWLADTQVEHVVLCVVVGAIEGNRPIVMFTRSISADPSGSQTLRSLVPAPVHKQVLGQRRPLGPARPSEHHRLGEDPIPKMRRKAPLRDHVDLEAKRLLQLVTKGHEVEQAAAFRHVDEKINVAGLARLTPSRRPEQANVPRPMGSRDPFDFLAPGEIKNLRDTHPSKGSAMFCLQLRDGRRSVASQFSPSSSHIPQSDFPNYITNFPTGEHVLDLAVGEDVGRALPF